jgi:hypothetical protein
MKTENIKIGRLHLIRNSYSYMICLPKFWVKHHKLDKRLYVICEMNKENNLIIKVEP